MAAQELLGLERQQVSVEHRGRLDDDLAEREGWQLDPKAAGLKDPRFTT